MKSEKYFFGSAFEKLPFGFSYPTHPWRSKSAIIISDRLLISLAKSNWKPPRSPDLRENPHLPFPAIITCEISL
jgi:hypothetical protein